MAGGKPPLHRPLRLRQCCSHQPHMSRRQLIVRASGPEQALHCGCALCIGSLAGGLVGCPWAVHGDAQGAATVGIVGERLAGARRARKAREEGSVAGAGAVGSTSPTRLQQPPSVPTPRLPPPQPTIRRGSRLRLHPAINILDGAPRQAHIRAPPRPSHVIVLGTVIPPNIPAVDRDPREARRRGTAVIPATSRRA